MDDIVFDDPYALNSRGTFDVSTHLEYFENLDWNKSHKALRNKATDNPGMFWTFHPSGKLSGTITLPDDPFPRESNSSIEISYYLQKTLVETNANIDSIQTIILRELLSYDLCYD